MSTEAHRNCLEGILRTSPLTSLSPDKLLLHQNWLLFISTQTSEESWYKRLVTVHALTGREDRSVSMDSTLLESLFATTVKATQILQIPGAHKSRHTPPSWQEVAVE